MTLTVYMVRHGQTLLNSYNRLQGWCDSPLTPKGTNDALSAGRHLKDLTFDAAYSSDTTRAIKTLRFILKENEAENKPEPKTLTYFREQSFGYFEGNDASQTWLMAGAIHGCRTYNDLLEKYSLGYTRDLLHELDPFKDAESDAQYWQRLDAGFDYLLKKHQPDAKILLVSHSITIRSIVDRYDKNLGADVLGPRNGSVTKLLVDPNNIQVAYYNHHLDNEKY